MLESGRQPRAASVAFRTASQHRRIVAMALASGVLEKSETEQYAVIFEALSEPVRMSIIREIARTDELPCTFLDEVLSVSKSTISYHIKQLHHASLISVRKEGRYYFYKLRRNVFDHFLPSFIERLVGDG
jgi:DNA-binding transcriptional ArsR family regulator